MLITSLVMSLNQLLPVAILLILLQVIAKQSLLRLLGMLGLGIGLTFLFVKSAPIISPWFDYQGLEYTQIGLCILIFFSALHYAVKQATAAFIIAIMSVMTLYLSHYIIYLIGFWQSNEAGFPGTHGGFAFAQKRPQGHLDSTGVRCGHDTDLIVGRNAEHVAGRFNRGFQLGFANCSAVRPAQRGVCKHVEREIGDLGAGARGKTRIRRARGRSMRCHCWYPSR